MLTRHDICKVDENDLQEVQLWSKVISETIVPKNARLNLSATPPEPAPAALKH
jgi:hypothetical protein